MQNRQKSKGTPENDYGSSGTPENVRIQTACRS